MSDHRAKLCLRTLLIPVLSDVITITGFPEQTYPDLEQTLLSFSACPYHLHQSPGIRGDTRSLRGTQLGKQGRVVDGATMHLNSPASDAVAISLIAYCPSSHVYVVVTVILSHELI